MVFSAWLLHSAFESRLLSVAVMDFIAAAFRLPNVIPMPSGKICGHDVTKSGERFLRLVSGEDVV